MKISAGKFKGRLLKSPPGSGKKTRPSSGRVKEAFFSMIGGCLEGKIFLDLFSGTGNMGLEALSRGAERAYFVEKDFFSLKILRRNIEITGTQARTKILPLDVLKALSFLSKERESFAVAYIDPPYKFPNPSVMRILHCLHRGGLVQAGGMIGVERSSRQDRRAGGTDLEAGLEKAPFLLWRKRIYGQTLLLIFRKE